MGNRLQLMEDLDKLGIGPSNLHYVDDNGGYSMNVYDILMHEAHSLGVVGERGFDMRAASELVTTPIGQLPPDKEQLWGNIDKVNSQLFDNITLIPNKSDAEKTIGASINGMTRRGMSDLVREENEPVPYQFDFVGDNGSITPNVYGATCSIDFSPEEVLEYSVSKDLDASLDGYVPGDVVLSLESPEDRERRVEYDTKLLESFDTIGIDVASYSKDGVNMSASELMYAEMDSLGLVDENGGIDTVRFQELYETYPDSLDSDMKEKIEAISYINNCIEGNLHEQESSTEKYVGGKPWDSSLSSGITSNSPKDVMAEMVALANDVQDSPELTVKIPSDSVSHYTLKQWQEESGITGVESLDGLQAIVNEHENESSSSALPFGPVSPNEGLVAPYDTDKGIVPRLEPDSLEIGPGHGESLLDGRIWDSDNTKKSEQVSRGDAAASKFADILDNQGVAEKDSEMSIR